MMNVAILLLLRLFTRWLHFKLPQKQPVDLGVGLKVCILSTINMVCIKFLTYTIIPHHNLPTLLNNFISAESNFVPEQRTIDSSFPNQPVCVNISSVGVESFLVFLDTSDPGVMVNSSAANAHVTIDREYCY